MNFRELAEDLVDEYEEFAEFSDAEIAQAVILASPHTIIEAEIPLDDLRTHIATLKVVQDVVKETHKLANLPQTLRVEQEKQDAQDMLSLRGWETSFERQPVQDAIGLKQLHAAGEDGVDLAVHLKLQEERRRAALEVKKTQELKTVDQEIKERETEHSIQSALRVSLEVNEKMLTVQDQLFTLYGQRDKLSRSKMSESLRQDKLRLVNSNISIFEAQLRGLQNLSGDNGKKLGDSSEKSAAGPVLVKPAMGEGNVKVSAPPVGEDD